MNTKVSSAYMPVPGAYELPAAVVMTAGAFFVAEYGGRSKDGARWLMEAIALAQRLDALRDIPFQVWTLRVFANRSAVLVATDNRQASRLHEQQIPLTDFPIPGCILYVVDGAVANEDGVFRVICTPSEWGGAA